MCWFHKKFVNWSNETCTELGAHVVGINYESTVDGEGIRMAIYLGGCKHNCPGCHNPETHSFHAGRLFDEELQDKLIAYLHTHPYIQGITLTGGDPMYSAAYLIPFVERVKMATDCDIWCYTGFSLPEVRADMKMAALLSFCDVLVDGPYIEAFHDETLPFRGSSNQTIHYLTKKHRKKR